MMKVKNEMTLLKWFGIEKIDKHLRIELDLLQSILDDVSNIEQVLENLGERKKKISLALAKRGKNLKKGLAIQKTVEKTLRPYIQGKKKTKRLAWVLLLHTMIRDFQQDHLWTELTELWNQEHELLKTGKKSPALRKNLEEQQRIALTLKKINELEFNETHVHFDTSADADLHWKYFKKLWKKAAKEIEKDPEKKKELSKIKSSDSDELEIEKYRSNIILLLEVYSRKHSWRGNYPMINMSDRDALHNIMRNLMTNKWSDTKAFVEFVRLLIMPEEEFGTFRGFQKKAEIVNMIQWAAMATEMNRDYLIGTLRSIAKHNLAHNITYVEIRYPLKDLEDAKFWVEMTKEVEEENDDKIAIRYVQFPVRTPEALREFYERYSRFPKKIQKYIVGVDYGASLEKHPEVLKLSANSGLALCVHAGEIFKKDVATIEHALHEVETALNQPTIRRIGHATILGIPLDKYLKGKATPAQIKRLKAKQKALIDNIRLRPKGKRVYIETNPSSNVQIGGLGDYTKHPIQEFDRQGIPYAISTDDRINFDTNLKKEFYRIARAFKWEQEQIEKAAEMQKRAKLPRAP